jgi:chromate transporter
VALALVYSQFADHHGVAGALRGMGAVAAGLIMATGIKLISALNTNVLGWRWCAALGLSCLTGIAVFRLPLAYVLFGLGSLAFSLAFRKMKP